MKTDISTSRRSQRRHRVLKGGRIIFYGGDSTIDCVIRDLSDTGARLRVESVIGIPDNFELSASGEHIRHCRIRWRKAAELGVEFVVPEAE